MDLPDDKTWTWDEMIEVAAEVAAKAERAVRRRSQVFAVGRHVQRVRCARTARSCSRADGLGFEAADAQAWFELMVKAAEGQGDRHAAADQRGRLARRQAARPERDSRSGTTAMQHYNSNQLEAVTKAAGTELAMLRFPSLTGKATDRKAWYKASHAVVGVGQDQEPGRGYRLDRLVGELPRVRPTSTWPSAASRATPRSWPRSRPSWTRTQQAVVEVHRRHQARARQHPDRPAARRRHARSTPCCGTRPMCCSGGPARPTPRRSSWTSSSRTCRTEATAKETRLMT